ncbi:hypothetical protein [Wolbachia endosymbiont of Aedes albopictus]|nr:hypothetical protein [Wolbachia endosymbiont of Aedes albopictus]UVW83567.1 hypothetical protein NHG98_04275 [Wolbachia endosymbiont of Aedes albopictus]
MHAATYLKLNFLDPSSQGTGMTGEGGYLYDILPCGFKSQCSYSCVL